MIWSILLLLLGIWSLASTINALRPIRQDWLLLPSMVWSWIVIELPARLVLFQVVLAAVLLWLDALGNPVGWLGLALLVLSWLGTIVLVKRARSARTVVATALDAAGIPPSPAPVPRWRVLLSYPFRGRAVRKVHNVDFRRVAGRVLRLDIYRPREQGRGRPVLLYIHGGGWTVGDKTEQGLPLMHHLARNGWVCVTANYRLSPGATFPDHLEDMKAALAWVKEHVAEHGGDPGFIAVCGGSAGGHLASLVALTDGDLRYQPGFEEADTSVQAAVLLYGIYDLTNRLEAQSSRFVPLLMEPILMKAFLDEEPGKYRDGSPIDRVHPGAPPALVIQGDLDTFAPVVEARAFVERLDAESEQPVTYMEFPGAQHVFDFFWSYRSARMIEGVTAFLEHERARAHRRGSGSPRDGA